MINDDFNVNSIKAIVSEYNKNQLYFMPHPLLRSYISHYTLTYSIISDKVEDNTLSDDLIIIPDGSGCLIYEFNNGNIYETCWGPTSKPVKVKKNMPTENKKMFFIEFLPSGLYALTGICQKELKDLKCTIYEIDKKLSKSLRNIILSSKNVDELILNVDKFFLSIIEKNNRMQPSIISIINKIKLTGGTIPIKRLAESEYISERHLSRIFERNVGIGIKAFERLTRINKVVKLYKESTKYNVTYIAQESGYYDLSHLIHEFNEFCGTTPNSFIRNVSDFYNEPFKY